MSTTVTYGLNYTRNLQNFENVKVHVEVSDDVRQGENTQQALDRVAAFVEKNLLTKVEEMDSDLRS